MQFYVEMWNRDLDWDICTFSTNTHSFTEASTQHSFQVYIVFFCASCTNRSQAGEMSGVGGRRRNKRMLKERRGKERKEWYLQNGGAKARSKGGTFFLLFWCVQSRPSWLFSPPSLMLLFLTVSVFTAAGHSVVDFLLLATVFCVWENMCVYLCVYRVGL